MSKIRCPKSVHFLLKTESNLFEGARTVSGTGVRVYRVHRGGCRPRPSEPGRNLDTGVVDVVNRPTGGKANRATPTPLGPSTLNRCPVGRSDPLGTEGVHMEKEKRLTSSVSVSSRPGTNRWSRRKTRTVVGVDQKTPGDPPRPRPRPRVVCVPLW